MERNGVRRATIDAARRAGQTGLQSAAVIDADFESGASPFVQHSPPSALFVVLAAGDEACAFGMDGRSCSADFAAPPCGAFTSFGLVGPCSRCCCC